MNTVHVDDVAQCLWVCSQWMSGLGRAEADKIAGEEIFFNNDKSKVNEVTGMPPATQKIIAPLFNLVSPCAFRAFCGFNPKTVLRWTTTRRRCTRLARRCPSGRALVAAAQVVARSNQPGMALTSPAAASACDQGVWSRRGRLRTA